MSQKNNQFLEQSKKLYVKLSEINAGIQEMELYEFRYGLENFKPRISEWSSEIQSQSALEEKISDHNFYEQIVVKPKKNNKIILDKNILELNQSLFAGIIKGVYDINWVDKHFYFDIRGFIFIPRTVYFTDEVLNHLRQEPFKKFKQRQKKFDSYQGIGYKDFKNANQEIDLDLIQIINKLCLTKNPPIVIAIAGPTAAGKTEFSEILRDYFHKENKTISSLEIDNFLKDRDYRDSIGSGIMSKDSIHFEMFKESLLDLKNGDSCTIPEYDFTNGISSHNDDKSLREQASTISINPADIIFLEGNYPFLFEEIALLIDIKIFYLTDDPIRLKRKWKRDIDYRKKYNSNYLCNRYFRTQFLKAESTYLPQLKTCDIAVDTTKANIYISDDIEKLL